MTHPAESRSGSIRLGRLAALLLLAGPLSCTNGDSLTSPPDNSGRGRVPWSVNLNYRAINLAAGEQLQLAVNPLDADRNPMSGLPPVVYTVSDTSVRVDANGLLTARSVRSNILLVATLSSLEGNWTRTDSARIDVVAAPYPIAAIRMLPNGPAIQPANQLRRFNAVAVDAAGNVLRTATGDTVRPRTHYVSSAPRNQYYLSNPWDGVGRAQNLGEATVRGATYAFGKSFGDSVRFQVTYPDTARITVHRVNYNLTPSPSMLSQTDVTVLQGGTVYFQSSNTTRQDDIVFQNQTNVVGGNLPAVSTAFPGSAVRFPVAGTFTYESKSMNARGTITVVPWP